MWTALNGRVGRGVFRQSQIPIKGTVELNQLIMGVQFALYLVL